MEGSSGEHSQNRAAHNHGSRNAFEQQTAGQESYRRTDESQVNRESGKNVRGVSRLYGRRINHAPQSLIKKIRRDGEQDEPNDGHRIQELRADPSLD